MDTTVIHVKPNQAPSKSCRASIILSSTLVILVAVALLLLAAYSIKFTQPYILPESDVVYGEGMCRAAVKVSLPTPFNLGREHYAFSSFEIKLDQNQSLNTTWGASPPKPLKELIKHTYVELYRFQVDSFHVRAGRRLQIPKIHVSVGEAGHEKDEGLHVVGVILIGPDSALSSTAITRPTVAFGHDAAKLLANQKMTTCILGPTTNRRQLNLDFVGSKPDVMELRRTYLRSKSDPFNSSNVVRPLLTDVRGSRLKRGKTYSIAIYVGVLTERTLTITLSA